MCLRLCFSRLVISIQIDGIVESVLQLHLQPVSAVGQLYIDWECIDMSAAVAEVYSLTMSRFMLVKPQWFR